MCLKRIFVYRKKQKQENRKEHEKEAGMEDDLWNEQQFYSNSINDRSKSRFGNEASGRNSSYPPNTSMQTANLSYRRYMDPLERQHRRREFEKRMEQIDIEKRMNLAHANNCAIFGLSSSETHPASIPVKVNRVTGEYYDIFENKIPRPPNYQDFKYGSLTLSTNPNDYHLPSIDLPEHWRFAIDKNGRIYYYHDKIRISQWVI